MPKVKRNNKNNQKFNLYLFLITIVLLLTVINLEVFFYKQINSPPPTEVLGAETTDEELQLWMNVTRQNPWYLPAWVEIAKIAIDKNDRVLKDRAIENIERIDPNNKFLLD